MKIDKRTTLEKFVYYVDVFGVTEKQFEGYLDQIKDYPLPEHLKVSFNDLKFRQLIELQNRVATFLDLIFVPFEVVHGLPKEKVLKMSAFDCLAFALYSKDELERITKLFKAIEYKPTSEEQQAGINTISHGFFGTIDWYARRMGITDHDEVVELNWMRIYQCLKIDFDNNKFEKNYRKVITQKK
ncbi:MAG: hypothetical protein ACLVKO_09180 [Dysgonomonas sp.]